VALEALYLEASLVIKPPFKHRFTYFSTYRKESPNTPLPSSNASGGGSDKKSSSYFIALDSTIENLQERTQQLIDKINENRKKDHVLMNSFKESLLMKVSSLAEKLEERVFPVYDHNNKLIQDKLQELSEIMERIREIETELRQVCHTVEMLYKDLCAFCSSLFSCELTYSDMKH
uniref:Synaptonemal complex central element protein 2 n=1 Tax=Varanus komodoensis TaxID=61221 RepID=A0A8D2Q5S0_VARKO